VGADGPTHAGAFDLSFLRCIPNMLIAAPSDENECRQLLTTAFRHDGPSAVRYPRGTGTWRRSSTRRLESLPSARASCAAKASALPCSPSAAVTYRSKEGC
jgi:deoxyxylulose-5-phosphate synthase